MNMHTYGSLVLLTLGWYALATNLVCAQNIIPRRLDLVFIGE